MPLSEGDVSFLDSVVGSPDNMVPSMDSAMQTDPDRYAENLRLVESEGLPLDTVERNRDKIDQRNRLNSVDFVKLRETNPGLTSYLSDPDNAGVSSDDVDNLKRIEDTLIRYERPWYEVRTEDFEGLGATTVEAIKQGFRGLRTAALDIPSTATSEEFRQQEQAKVLEAYRAGEERIKELTPEDMSTLAQGVRGGIQSLVMNAPGLAATILTRNPAYMMSLMGGQVGGESYGQARAEGLEPGESTFFAAKQTAIELITEMIPAKKLVDIVGGGKRAKDILGFGISEIGGEQAATLLQSINEYGHGLDKQLEAATTLDEVLEIQGQRQAVTLFAALVGSGSQAGIATGASYMLNAADKKINGDMERVGQTLHEQAILDEAVELAQSNATLGRAPERYSAFLEKVGKDTEIVIDGAALEGVEGLPDYIDPSLGDVEIGAELFMRDIASNPELMEQLRPHIKMSHDAMNRTEMEQDERADIRKLMERAQAAEDTKSEADVIFETVKGQLAATGRQSEETARVSAQLYPAYATVLAERYKDQGETVESVFQDMGFQVVGPAEMRAPEVELEQALRQSITPIELQNEGDVSLVETGKPVSFYFTHNIESATGIFGKPKKGDPYGRDFEPSARFVSVASKERADTPLPGHITGKLTFFNPLVVPSEGVKWKEKLSKQYGGKTGMALSKAVIADGYDGIITTEDQYISETIDLTTFDETKALYQSMLPVVELEQAAGTGYEGQDASEATEWNAAYQKFGEEGMTQEARMERAEAMGFDTGQVLYKGMYPYDWTKETEVDVGPEIMQINRTTPFPAFMEGDPGVDIAGFLTPDVDVANRFAREGAVYPLLYKSGREYVIDANSESAGDVQFGESGSEFREAIRSGEYDTISIVNTSDEGDIIVALNPNQIRSVNAAFDPERAESAELLAQAAARDQKRINTLEQLQECLR